MIKLIASDMDGTLLTPEGKIPNDFFDIFEKLKEKNIHFVVASGRPYKTLYENFKPISDELYYISDNGAIVSIGSKILEIDFISPKIVNEIFNAFEDRNDVTLVICGEKSAYHKACPKEVENEIDKYFLGKTIINSFDEINDKIYKISICDLNKAKDNIYPFAKENFGNKVKTVLAGKSWVDFTNEGVNKGNALEKFQKEQNITPEETMVFGDYFNDVEMLKKAKYSYVMENALDEMKKYGNYTCKSNKENGVIKVLEELLSK